ncbi:MULTISPECIES: TIGR01244 family sulfur transferase [Roseobacter]|uniref:TIGR01244 family sulfur transferase n=1 Tax=Roseobacter TaxID=2433 RepID=UPI001BC762BE|nr:MULTISPECIES: TIGR01244 family sulfur transferase [Roseobacter]GIT85574.1 TIGR01244 family protein [Roseobacter sp. OBYS 0001]
MDIREVTPKFSVAPQISPDQMHDLVAAGFKRVLCNRPDAEVPVSHQAAAMEAAAKQAGLEFFACPLTHVSMTPDIIAKNHDLIDGCDGPVIAYCASGTRSTIAWALAATKSMSVDDVLSAARAAGYELGNLRPTLEAAAKS